MKIYFSKNFIKKSTKLIKKNPLFEKKFAKQISLFRQNKLHPSLKTHKLKGQRSEQFAVWIEGDLRAVCVQDGDAFVFFDLITHDKY